MTGRWKSTEKLTAMNKFTSRLQKYFADNPGTSMRALAREAGISHVHMTRIRSGENVPSLDIAERIAIAMGTTLSEILTESKKMAQAG